jgi:hypothetical protein
MCVGSRIVQDLPAPWIQIKSVKMRGKTNPDDQRFGSKSAFVLLLNWAPDPLQNGRFQNVAWNSSATNNSTRRRECYVPVLA